MIVVEQVDALIHPDYNIAEALLFPKLSLTPNPQQDTLRIKWEQRTKELRDTSVLLYFSIFPSQVPLGTRFGDLYHSPLIQGAFEDPKVDLLRTEFQRRERLRNLLKDRFIFFGVDERFSLDQIVMKLFKNGFKIRKDDLFGEIGINLLVYGEYLQYCVNEWKKHLDREFRLKPYCSQVSDELSYPRLKPYPKSRFLSEIK